MTPVRRLLRRFLGCEDGTATIEFVVMIPMVMIIFMASIEAGWYQAKSVMLERGLDMTIREVRLGNVDPVDHDTLRDMICDRTPILNDCQNILKVELRPVNTATYAMPSLPPTCVDRGLATQALTDVIRGGSNEIMVVRICAIQDPMFPTTGIGLELRADAQGGYQLIAASVFVNEPS